MAVTHDPVAAIGQFQIIPRDEGVSFSNQRLRKHSTRAFACKLAQRIIDSIRLTEGDDSGISRQGWITTATAFAGDTVNRLGCCLRSQA